MAHRKKSVPWIALSVTGLFIAQALPGHARDASVWDKAEHSAVRLIAGAAVSQQSGPTLRAGLEIRLDPGWKTYWRYPGDSGVPPRMDFAQSDNVKAVVIKWPAPRRFVEDGDTSIGYQGNMIFPLHVVPLDPGKPVILRLALDYGVCEKWCVLVQGKAELALATDGGTHEASLAAAEVRVPKQVPLGDGGALAIRAVKREANEVIVDLTSPRDAVLVDLFAEGPTADWALPVPRPAADATSGLKRFSFALEGLPPGARLEGAIRLTAIADDQAIEVLYHLD